jgi:hypothetical protein
MINTSGFKAMVYSLLVLHVTALTVCSHAGNFTGTAAYGSKVRFKAAHTLHFPDFQITYIGKRHVTPPQYPRGWWIYDFKVRGKSNEQTVSWSAGTGDIGPSRFKVDGTDFQIELSRSDKLGPLREDEMVVSSVKLL